jgi:hypothetical protein
MNPIKFEGHNRVFAENQPQYRPLPAHKSGDEEGTLTFCWKLSWKERFQIFISGRLWHQVLTFNSPLQPQLPLTTKPMLTEQHPIHPRMQ